MPEASSTTAAAWGAWLSAVALALLGVDYYALLGAFGGVLLTLSSVQPIGRWRVIATVAITTFAAAALGQGFAEVAGIKSRSVVIALSVIVGAGGQMIVQAAVAALVARISRFGSGT